MDGFGQDGEIQGRSSVERIYGTNRCCGFTKTEILFTVVITIMSIGVNFSLDLPASLETIMSDYYDLSQYQFSLLYTFYFLPSLLLSAFGGYLIDNTMGIRISAILYSIIAVVGIMIFVIGGYTNALWVMLLGRFIFGLGNEMATGVCMSYCTYSYFSRSSSVNFMFSMSDNTSFIGTLAVFQLAPFLFQVFQRSRSPKSSVDIVILICSLSYVLTASLAIWTVFIKPPNDDYRESLTDQNESTPIEDNHIPQNVSVYGDTEQLIPSTYDRHDIDDRNDQFNQNEVNMDPIRTSIDNSSTGSNHVTLNNVISFPITFWLLCLTYTCYTSAVFTFETFSQGLFISDLFNLSIEEASNAITIMNVITIALSIPLSLVVDKIGKNILFVATSMFLGVLSFALLAMKIHPYGVMALLGLSYALTGSSIWAMFAYPIGKNLRGSCYGIVSAVIGISQTISPSVVGTLVDKFGFSSAIYFFLANAVVAAITILVTWMLDMTSEGVLYMTPQQRIERDSSLRNSRNGSIPNETPQDWNPHLIEDAPG